MLVRLMYASRAVPAVDQEELIAILKKSKVNNAKSGVTGALCFSEGVFIQVLEGGRTAVSKLYNRIASDARHTQRQRHVIGHRAEHRESPARLLHQHAERLARRAASATSAKRRRPVAGKPGSPPTTVSAQST